MNRINIIAMNTELNIRPVDRILCVKVGKRKRENLYEMTRKYWKVRLDRVSKATHVFAVINSVVVAVYIPESWGFTKDAAYAGRVEFVGKEDVKSPYVGMNVKSLYGQSANPVKYINM